LHYGFGGFLKKLTELEATRAAPIGAAILAPVNVQLLLE